MVSTTESIIKAALTADQTITGEDAEEVMLLLKGKSRSSDDGDYVWSRKEVAARMGKSVKCIDVYARRGIIKRVYLTGGGSQRRQAQGFSRKSVLDAIANGTAG